MPQSDRVRLVSSISRMSMRKRSRALATAISSALACAPSLGVAQQEALRPEEEVIVTATRRTESIQDVPLNITAVGGEEIQEQGISNLAELTRVVPGLFVVNQGGRASNQIVVRGLNANTITGSEALGNNGGNTVQTYIGEIPLYLDLKPDDIERVEVLMGPQGTLYGAGTLGGAIRYIPRRPQFHATTLQVRGDAYGLAESDGIGSDVGLTANIPISETIAFRGSVGYLDDPGFVDYNYIVREAGVSDPEPDFNNPADVAANLRRKKDVDDEQTLSGRAALRFKPIDALDINLTYYYQDQENGGRTMDQRVAFDTPRYVSAQRFEEPNDRKNQLLALEMTADLGFAELTSATGRSRYREHGSRDQTDLLITLEYSYEAFPSFSAFTREKQKDKTFNQEFRLVSKSDGPWDWIAGVFYNRLERRFETREFTPGYAEFVTGGVPGVDFNAEGLEFFQADKTDRKEKAVYGELRYHFTDQWQVTVGGRWYKYDLETGTNVQFPVFSTELDPIEFEPGGQKHDGTLFKFNTSYDFTDDLMAYLTISEGYRIGNSNGVAPCDDDQGTSQNGCGQPDELQYKPDTTTNYEIGLRSEWLEGQVVANGSIFYVDWKDPQLASTTDNGAIPIVRNGKGARSQGFEVNLSAYLTEQLAMRASYSYTDAELTDDAPSLLNTFVPPGFNSTRIDVDGEKGDRLPGSPKHQGSLWLTYEVPAFYGFDLDLNYGLASQSSVLTKTGGRASGELLGGFTTHYAAAILHAKTWSIGLYAENLFNKYAATGVRSTRASNQTVEDADGNPVRVRSYYHDLLRPREVGLRFTYDFEL